MKYPGIFWVKKQFAQSMDETDFQSAWCKEYRM
jgi:hypothetical protein